MHALRRYNLKKPLIQAVDPFTDEVAAALLKDGYSLHLHSQHVVAEDDSSDLPLPCSRPQEERMQEAHCHDMQVGDCSVAPTRSSHSPLDTDRGRARTVVGRLQIGAEVADSVRCD